MEAEEAVRTRRSIAKVGEERPRKDEIAILIGASVLAPNHYLSQPWRFIVLAGAGLDRLGDAMAERVRDQFSGSDDLEQRVEMEKARAKRAPVIVTVVYRPSDNPQVLEVEDRYAVGAAIQNILLVAHARGLGAYLRTGPAATDPQVRRFLGLTDNEEIAGFIYVGYPEGEAPEPQERVPAEDRTTWLGWE